MRSVYCQEVGHMRETPDSPEVLTAAGQRREQGKQVPLFEGGIQVSVDAVDEDHRGVWLGDAELINHLPGLNSSEGPEGRTDASPAHRRSGSPHRTPSA